MNLEEELRQKYNLSDKAIIEIQKDKGNDILSLLSFCSAPGMTPVGSVNTTKYLGEAGNQYNKGVRFTNAEGGLIYWSDDSTPTVSVNFTLNTQVFSVGVSIGNKASYVTGYSIKCPPNKWCELTITKDLEITRYRYHIYDSHSGLDTEGYVNKAETLGVTLGLNTTN